MKRVSQLGCAALLVAAAACGGTQAPPYQIHASVHELMAGAVEPPAEVIWDSVATIVDAEGIHEHFPQNDEEWEYVEHNAVGLAEVANLLLLPGRALGEGEAPADPDPATEETWLGYVDDLRRTSLQARDLAKAQDIEGILEVGELIYNSCTGCHRAYIIDEEQPLPPR